MISVAAKYFDIVIAAKIEKLEAEPPEIHSQAEPGNERNEILVTPKSGFLLPNLLLTV